MAYKNPEDRRAYARKHYVENKDAYFARAKAHKIKHDREVRDLIKAFKSVPCQDCGQTFPPVVMDFDHRGDKLINLGDVRRTGWSIKRVTEEIKKCDVICSNCHRIRTHGADG